MKRTSEIGAFEAKNTLGTLLDRVQQGEEIVITRHGKAVARLIPNEARIDQQKAGVALQRIRDRAEKLNKTKAGRLAFDWPSLKKLRDEGRP